MEESVVQRKRCASQLRPILTEGRQSEFLTLALTDLEEPLLQRRLFFGDGGAALAARRFGGAAAFVQRLHLFGARRLVAIEGVEAGAVLARLCIAPATQRIRSVTFVFVCGQHFLYIS